jgi:DoxX-like family
MKKLNWYYWVPTILFAALMLFSSFGGIVLSPEALTFMGHLGYPVYFIQFISWAKLLGVIAILIPGFRRITEWAYAGLFFDLVGAVYSNVAVDGFNGGIIFMLLAFLLFALSYVFYHKTLAA